VLFRSQIAALPALIRGDQAQAMLFLDLYGQGILIDEIFWGLWLFPLGYLAFKSGFLPKLLGILLMIGSSGYFLESFLGLVLPASKGLAAPGLFAGMIAEFAMIFWLSVFGARRRP
jgi:hypothetical protein